MHFRLILYLLPDLAADVVAAAHRHLLLLPPHPAVDLVVRKSALILYTATISALDGSWLPPTVFHQILHAALPHELGLLTNWLRTQGKTVFGVVGGSVGEIAPDDCVVGWLEGERSEDLGGLLEEGGLGSEVVVTHRPLLQN
jgi:hypothetical protein